MSLNSSRRLPIQMVLVAFVASSAFLLAGCSSRAQRAESYYKEGMSYLEKQDFVKARIELRNALQLKGDMVEAWRGLAKIDEHDRNIPGLAGDLRRIVELDPKDLTSTLALTRLLLLGGSFAEALKLTNAALDLDPNNAETFALKAAVLYRLKDANGSMAAARKALALDTGNSDASVILAAAQNSQGDSAGALRTLDNVASAHKNDLQILYLKFDIFNQTGNLTQAESSLRQLVELNPKTPALRTQLVKFYLSHNRQDDAINELRTFVAANPGDTNAELQLVNLLAAVKGVAAARAELVARINAGGNVFPYQIALAKFDFAQGDVAGSTKLLEHLISSARSSEDALTARAVLAEIYLTKNNAAAAEPLVTEILRADARNINGLRLRALIHLDRSQIDDAIADLRSALNDQPRSPELLATLAIAYERSGSIELADKAFFDATKASNFLPEVGLNYIAFLRRHGLSAQADTFLNELVNRNQNNVALLAALAQVKLAHQDWSGAHEIADTIKRLGDKGDLSDQINAAAFGGQKQLDSSVTALQNVYNANPGAIQPMAALVSAYLRSGQVDKAESTVQAALHANPKNAEALVLMGSIQLAKNNPTGAIVNFNSAIKEQPKDIVGYRALADLYIRQKKYDEALNIVKQGLQEQPGSFALRLSLAGIMEAKGEYKSAITEYESMLKEQPGSMIVANNLASLLTDRRTDKASLDQANSIALLLRKSEVPQFKDTSGWIAYRRGDYTAASSLLEQAAAAMPNIPMVHYHLGMAYLATGQEAKASEQFKKVQELAPNDADLKMKIDSALKAQSAKTKG